MVVDWEEECVGSSEEEGGSLDGDSLEDEEVEVGETMWIMREGISSLR